MAEIKLKSIPSPSNLPPEVQAFAFPVKEAIDLLLGRVGDGKDAAITRRNAGQALGGTTIINTGSASGGGYVPDLTAPPAPTGLVATPGFSVINLEWDDAPYTVGHGHAYTAVYRSSDSLRGNAEMIGFAPGTIYVDAVGSSAGPFYYWIRFVTRDGARDGAMGPWNAVSGISASTATDPAYLLGLLAGSITEASLKTEVVGGKDAFVFNTKTFAIKYGSTGYVPFIVQTVPTTINGHVISPGVYLDEAFMRRFVAQSGQIGALAVDDAAIANLSAAKLTAGDGTIGGRLKSTFYAPGVSGWQVNPDGTAEFNDVLVRGTVYAESGYFKGTLVGGAATAFSSGTGLWAGYDSGQYKTRIGTSTGSRLEWNGSALTIYGASGQVLLSSGSGLQWDQVSGNGRPEDNATVGANIGSNLSGTFDTTNIGVYMPSAAIGDAQIDRGTANKLKIIEADIVTASVSTLKIKGNAVTVPAYVETGGFQYSGQTYTQFLLTSGMPFADAGKAMVMLVVSGWPLSGSAYDNAAVSARFEALWFGSNGATTTSTKDMNLGDFYHYPVLSTSVATTYFDLYYAGTYFFRTYLKIVYPGQTLHVESMSLSVTGIMR